jgi:hypothetical protein
MTGQRAVSASGRNSTRPRGGRPPFMVIARRRWLPSQTRGHAPLTNWPNPIVIVVAPPRRQVHFDAMTPTRLDQAGRDGAVSPDPGSQPCPSARLPSPRVRPALGRAAAHRHGSTNASRPGSPGRRGPPTRTAVDHGTASRTAARTGREDHESLNQRPPDGRGAGNGPPRSGVRHVTCPPSSSRSTDRPVTASRACPESFTQSTNRGHHVRA